MVELNPMQSFLVKELHLAKNTCAKGVRRVIDRAAAEMAESGAGSCYVPKEGNPDLFDLQLKAQQKGLLPQGKEDDLAAMKKRVGQLLRAIGSKLL